MPVVSIQLSRFCKMVGATERKVVGRLPFVGLDIEGMDGKVIRVEYSPNRPDFGTDYGIARALRGQMGKEIGMVRYRCNPSGVSVFVDPRLAKVRPYIACMTATNLKMDNEDVRQLISLQEDLHNGLGRRRRRVAIGIHDMAKVTPPIVYEGKPRSFRFAPLDHKEKLSLGEVLTKTDQGREYGDFFQGTRLFPIISDSAGVVLSFPPIINGNATKVSSKTGSLFVDVTSTDMLAGDDVLAVLATTLAEMGARISSVAIVYRGSRRLTPDLKPSRVRLDMGLIEEVLGLGLSEKQVAECIRRSRLDLVGNSVVIPRYRTDILHPVDVAEEVALGYGIDNISPLYPASKQPGVFNRLDQFIETAADLMVGSGMVELINYELVDEPTLYGSFGRSPERKIAVENPKSVEHSILRDSLLPPLMAFLGRNVKEEYPQRVFEIGRVYSRKGRDVSEEWHLGCLIAHSQASYTEAKMYLESFVRLISGRAASTRPSTHWAFIPGRTATVLVGKKQIGQVGEVKPEAITAFRLGVPVSGFDLDVSALYERLK